MLIVGCSVAPPATFQPSATPTETPAPPSRAPDPDRSPTEQPCAPIATEPPAMPELPPDIDAATAEAVRQRIEYGLRHDVFWVEHVAGQPDHTMAWGFPMLPSEETLLFSRNPRTEVVQAALARYGHVDEFGGLWIDQSIGGVVVLAWTRDLARHESAMRAELPACFPVLFRQVTWSEVELRDLQDRIAADWDWFAEIPAAPQGVGADVTESVVEIDVSSANPAAADIILAHYGAPAGMLRVRSDGTGAALLPTGTVRGVVVLADGSPPGDAAGSFHLSDAPGGDPGWCGGGDVGYGVAEDGSFEYPCKVGRRVLQILDLGAGEDPHPVIGQATVIVPANGVVNVRIVVDWQRPEP
jgi:hypothetical protein